jgi:hypothetical protein
MPITYKILHERLIRVRSKYLCAILHPFQIISRFGFSRYIDFAMHLDITYIWMRNKNYAPKKAKTTINLGQRE